MKLSANLKKYIQALRQREPDVLIYVDEKSLYWVTSNENGNYVWLQDHKGINEYIDGKHPLETLRPTINSTENVGREGVYWLNLDFENPFHISDFMKIIDTITI